MDYYEVLGVDEDATQEQIKAAYRTLAKKYHPDVNDAPNAAAVFRLIQEAYENLNEPVKRKRYDNVRNHSACQKNSQEENYTPPPPHNTNTNTNQKEQVSSGEEVKTSQKLYAVRGRSVPTKILLVSIRIIFAPFIPIAVLLCVIFQGILSITSVVSKILSFLSLIGIVAILISKISFTGYFKNKILDASICLLAAILFYFLPRFLEWLTDLLEETLDKCGSFTDDISSIIHS